MASKRFSFDSIRDEKLPDGTRGFFFGCDLLEEFPDVFGHCENSGHVEQDLKDAGVVKKGNKCNSGGIFRVTFKTKKQGEYFITRLNNYLSRISGLMP